MINPEDFINQLQNEQIKKDEGFDLVDKKFISLFWNFLFSKWAQVVEDERFKLNKEEDEFLTNATVKWLNYRLPSIISKYSVDFEFIFALISVVITKLIITEKISFNKDGKQDNSNFGTEGTGQNNISKENT
jgi:hypothetical protein